MLIEAGFGPVVRDLETSRDFYGDALGIRFDVADGGYHHTQALDGA